MGAVGFFSIRWIQIWICSSAELSYILHFPDLIKGTVKEKWISTITFVIRFVENCVEVVDGQTELNLVKLLSIEWRPCAVCTVAWWKRRITHLNLTDDVIDVRTLLNIKIKSPEKTTIRKWIQKNCITDLNLLFPFIRNWEYDAIF